MPWHSSKSDPRKVYDQNHDVVCVCMNPAQATQIVSAVNQAREKQSAEPLASDHPAILKPNLVELAGMNSKDAPDTSFAVVRR